MVVSLAPAAILTQLHWSLPRPLSNAERQLSAELDVVEARQAALASAWGDVRARAGRALDQQQQQQQRAGGRRGAGEAGERAAAGGATGGKGESVWRKAGGLQLSSWWGRREGAPGAAQQQRQQQQAAGGVHLPPSQLAAVHGALLEHVGAISACQAELARMQQEVKAWAEQRVADAAGEQLLSAGGDGA